jgi:hypothetical protein
LTKAETTRQSTAAENPSADRNIPTLFSVLRDVVLLVGIYAYFAGWIYVFYYYQEFDTPLSELEIPAYYFAVYAYSALYNFWGITTVLLAAVVLAFLNTRARAHPILISLVLLALFPILFLRARSTAVTDAYEDRFSGDNDRIVLFFRGETGRSYPDELIENNKANRLRFLAETKDSVVVFYQPRGESGAAPFLIVYDVSKQDLAATKKLVAGGR